jgi:hypothetical protein
MPHIIPKTTEIIKPIRAPLPHDFAFKGYSAFQTKYSINPTIGKQKHKKAKPPLDLSGPLAVVNL